MQKQKLSRSGIKISAMGMGCWAIGGPFWDGQTPLGWGEVDDRESTRALHLALDLGVNFFDTADVYGAGHSERVIGQALKNKRDQVIIATKFNTTFNEDTRQVTGWNVSPEYIHEACNASLRRLQTDYINLYQFHQNGYPVEKAGEVRETLEFLVKEGKIRSYGWSTDFADRASFFAQGENCTAIQFQENVLDDNPEVIDVCARYNLAGINRGPLAMGLLTGKYNLNTKPAIDDVRGEAAPEWMKYFINGKPNQVWLDKVNAVREILTSAGRTIAQGAIAWLWARSENLIPIPGFRTLSQVEENCASAHFGPLNREQMLEINQLLGR